MRQVTLAHVDAAVSIALYKDVKNSQYLRSQLTSRNPEFDYAMIDASSLLDCTHLYAGIFKGLKSSSNSSIQRTESVHSEIVISLAGTNSISDAYRQFGITDRTDHLVIVSVNRELDAAVRHLQQHVKGAEVDCTDDNLAQIRDIKRIRKTYKLTDVKCSDEELTWLAVGAMALQGNA